MPYRNPEDKRRWEREHRQERNDRRRKQRLGLQMPEIVPNPMPDPTALRDPKSTEYAVAIAIVVLSVGLLLIAFTVCKLPLNATGRTA
jgi:hypothetical protein